jgi:hypothetical protein
VRILLNGRTSGSGFSLPLYVLSEYYLVLCHEPMPETIPAEKFIDLQADLL